MTTDDLRKAEHWPKIEKIIHNAIDAYKRDFPNDKVEFKDKGTCFRIYINGNPVYEIDAISLLQ